MELITTVDCIDAFQQLFGRTDAPLFTVRYSGKFKGFNATIHKRNQFVEVRLSKQWQEAGKEIQLGCVQSLLQKLYKYPIKDDTGVQLYNTFVRHLGTVFTPVIEDAELQDAYDRMVAVYFDGVFDPCSVKWGTASYRTLGHYHYPSDTITLSTLLKGGGKFLDFVLYHEMVHKKVHFKTSRYRTSYHNKEFREIEQRFENFEQIEKDLSHYIAKARRRKRT